MFIHTIIILEYLKHLFFIKDLLHLSQWDVLGLEDLVHIFPPDGVFFFVLVRINYKLLALAFGEIHFWGDIA